MLEEREAEKIDRMKKNIGVMYIQYVYIVHRQRNRREVSWPVERKERMKDSTYECSWG